MIVLLMISLAQKASGPELTSGRPIPPEQACYDVLRYELSILVDPEKRSIEGNVEISARILDASEDMILDLDSRLSVASVLMCNPVELHCPKGWTHQPVQF